MISPINQLGTVGMIRDLSPADLPATAWTDGQNVRFLGTSIQQGPGTARLDSSQSAYLVYGIFPTSSGNSHYWVLCGQAAVQSFDGTTLDDITGSTTPSGTALDRWTGGMLNGVLVLNNGVNPPQMWDLPAAAANLADLTAWPASTSCRVMRPFKNFLVALDVTKSSVRDIRLVKWSHTAAPLTEPTSWDEADPTLDAGEVSLAEGQDALIDCLPLGDTNIIYTEGQTWSMRLSGTNTIFAFRLLFPESGLLAPDCAAAFRRGQGGPTQHFCVTDDDFIIHDGSNITSVGTDRVRRYFFDLLTSDSRQAVRVANKHSESEVWVFFAEGGGTEANKILAWNYQYNTWALYDTPNTIAVAINTKAPVVTATDLWNGDTGQWDADSSLWGTTTATAIVERLVVSEHPGRWLTEISSRYTTTVVGPISSQLKRLTLPLKGVAQGQPVLDHSYKAMVTRLWPKIVAGAATSFTILLGVTDDRDEEPNFVYLGSFTVGSARPVDIVTPPYRYLSIWILSSSTGGWKLSGIDWDISVVGRF